MACSWEALELHRAMAMACMAMASTGSTPMAWPEIAMMGFYNVVVVLHGEMPMVLVEGGTVAQGANLYMCMLKNMKLGIVFSFALPTSLPIYPAGPPYRC